MSERDRADLLLVSEGFRPALEHYRAAVAGVVSERTTIEREIEARLAQERSRIEKGLKALEDLRDEVIAMAGTVANHPDVAQLGEIGPAPPATVHDGPPDTALRAIHERVRARIAEALPDHAATHTDEGDTDTEGAQAGTAAEAAHTSTAAEALQASAAVGTAEPRDDADRHDHHVDNGPEEDAREDADEVLDDGQSTRHGCARWFGAVAVAVVVLLIGAVMVDAIPGSDLGFLCADPWLAVGTLLIECEAQDVPRQPDPEPPRPREPIDTSTQTPSECEGHWHTVRSGEGLERIAAENNTTRDRLQELNSTKIVNPDHIEVGWVLCIPKPEW